MPHLLSCTLQVNAWAPLQASHLLEGPISLRRNFNPRFLTLESEYQNKLRHACAGALMMRLAVDMMPPDVDSSVGAVRILISLLKICIHW